MYNNVFPLFQTLKGACEKCYVVKTRGVWNDMSKVVLSSDDDDDKN